MLRLLTFFILYSSFFTLSAQVKMRDVFAKMPDEMLPFVTTNNRLDCIDFIENGMQARVKNRVDEYVELKQMTTDYLLLQTSEVGQVEMKLFAQTDSTAVICMVETVSGPVADSYIRFFDQGWKELSLGDVQLMLSVTVQAGRPAVEAFFPSVPEEERTKVDDAINELRDLLLMEAHLSAEHDNISWTLSVEELSKDAKKAAREYVQPVVVPLFGSK